MEKKAKKKTIDTVIYILIGAMLLCMLLVAILTATFKKGEKVPETEAASEGMDIIPERLYGTESVKKDIETTIPPSVTTKDTGKSAPSSNPKPSDDIPVSVRAREYILPVEGNVSKEFEIDVPVYSLTMNDYRAHTGVDIMADVGSEVISVEDGTVCKVWNDPMMGKCVSVDHGDGIISTYMNLAVDTAPGIEPGVKLSRGQTIGAVGETSLTEIAEEPHLHLEMKVNGKIVDPMDYLGI